MDDVSFACTFNMNPGHSVGSPYVSFGCKFNDAVKLFNLISNIHSTIRSFYIVIKVGR